VQANIEPGSSCSAGLASTKRLEHGPSSKATATAADGSLGIAYLGILGSVALPLPTPPRTKRMRRSVLASQLDHRAHLPGVNTRNMLHSVRETTIKR
jgi:hypothetical protein